MKKSLAILLALITILSVVLVSCNNTSNPSKTGDDTENGLIIPGGTGDGTGTGTGNGTGSFSSDEWETISYSVYPVVDMNIRKGSTTGAKVAVKQSDALTAVAVKRDKNGDPDWYKLSYNNEEYYADAAYVSTNVSDTKFSALAEALTITIKAHKSDEDPYQVNLRQYPSFDSDIITLSVKKEHTDVNAIKAIEKSESGTWYYVEYNGNKYYLAVTSVTKPYLDGIPGNETPGTLPG